MKASKTISALILAAMGGLTGAAHAGRSLEVSIETGSRLVQLPANGQDAVDVRSCESCASKLYRLTPASTFEAQGQPLSLEKLRALFATNTWQVLVTLTPGTAQIRRIVITGPAGGQ